MTTEKNEPINSELESLANETIQADTTTSQLTPPAPESNEPTQADQLAAILLMVGQAGAMRFPSLANVYTETKCKMHAQAMAPALEKLGVNITAGETMIFLGAAGAVIMLGMETRTAIMNDIKAEQQTVIMDNQQKAQKANERKAKGESTATTTETPVHPQTALYPPI